MTGAEQLDGRPQITTSTRKTSDPLSLVLDVTATSDQTPDNKVLRGRDSPCLPTSAHPGVKLFRGLGKKPALVQSCGGDPTFELRLDHAIAGPISTTRHAAITVKSGFAAAIAAVTEDPNTTSDARECQSLHQLLETIWTKPRKIVRHDR